MTEQGGAGGSTPVQQQQQQSTATAVTSNPSSPTTTSAPSSIPSTQHAGSASLASLHTVRASKAYQRYAGEFDRLLTLLLRTPQADWAAQSAVLTQLLHHLDAARDVVGVAALPNALLFDQALARGLHVQNPLGVQRKALEVLVRYMTCLAASPWEQQQQQQQEQQTRLAATKASPSSSTGGAYTSPLHMDYPHLVLAVLELLPQSSMQLKGELMSFVERYVVDVLPPRLLRSCIYGILAAVLHCLEEAEASASYRQATRLLRNLQRRVSHDTSGCTMTSSTLTRSPSCTEACTGAAAFFATLWSLVRDCDALRAPALLYLRLSIAQLRLANDGSHARPAAARSTDNSFAVQNNNNSAAAAAAEVVTPVSSSPQPPASMSPSGNAEPHTRPNSPFVSAVSHTQPTSLERNNNNNNSNEEDDTWLGGAENRQLVLAALLTALQDRRERVQRLVLDLLIAYVPLSSSEARAGTMSGAASADHAGTMQGAAQVVHAPFSFASQTLLMTAAVQLVGLPGAKPAAGVLRRVVAWLCGPVSSLPSSSSAGGSDYIAHSSGYVLSQAFYGIVHWWEQTCLPAALGQSTGDTEVVVGISNSSSHNTGSSLPLTHAASTMSETTQNEAECAATLYVVLQQSAVSALAQGVGSSSSSSYRARDMQEYILPELALPYVWLSALVSLLHYSVTLDEDEAERAGALASPTMVHEVLATPATMSVQQGSSTNNNLMSSSSSGGEDAAGTRMATPLEQPVQGSETSAGEQAYPVLTAALPLLLPTLSHLLVCIQDLSSCSSSSSSSTGVPAMMEALLRRVFDIVPWQTFMQYNAGQVALLRGAIGPLLTQLQSLRAAAEDDEEEKKKRDVAQQDGNNTHAPSLLVPAEQLAEAAAAAAATNNNNIGGSSSDLHSPWRVLHAQVTQCVRQLRCTAQLLERHVVVQAQERPGQAAQLYSEVNTLVVQLAEVLQTLCEGLAGMSHVPALRAAHGSLPCVILRTFMQGTQALLHEYYLVLRAGLYAQLRLGLQAATTTTIVNDREDVTLPMLQAMTKASLSLLSLLRTHTTAMHTEACTAGRNVEWMTSVCSQLQRTIVSAITQATQLTRRAADSTSSSSPPDNKSERNTLGRVVQDWLTAQLALLEGDTLCTCLVWPMCEVMLDLAEAATPVPAEVALLLREQSTVTLRPLLHKLWAMLGHCSGSEEERSYRCERAVDLLLRAHDMAACRPTLDQFMACPAASVQDTREAELYTTCVRIAHLFLSVLHRHKTSEQQQRLRSGTKNNIAVALPRPVVGCMFFTGYCTLLRYMGAAHTPLTTQYDTMHRSCPVEQLWAELATEPSQLLQPWLEAFLAASQGIIVAASQQQQQQYTSDSSSGGESSARQVAVCAEDSSASSSSLVIAYRPVEVRELMSYMHTMLSCRTLSVERWVRRCAVEDNLPDTLRIQLTALELPLSTRINSARQETNTSSTNTSRNAKTSSSSSSSYAAAQTLRVTTWLGAVVKVLLGVFVQSLLLLPPQPRSTSSEADISRTSASREDGEHVQTALAAMHCVNLFLQHSLHEAAPTEAAIRIWRYSASQSVAWLQYSLTVRLPPVQAALATHIACAVQLLAGTRCDAHATYSSDLHQLPVLGPTHLQLIVDNKQQQQQRQPRTARSTNALTSGSSNSAAGNDEEGEDSDANGSAAGCTSVAAALRRSAPAVLALPALYQVLHAALAQPGAGGDNGCIIAQWSAFVQQLLPFLFRELRPATERIYNAFLHLLERTIAEAGTARQATGHVRCSSEASLAVQSACYDALTDIMSYLVLLAHAAEAEQQRRAAQKARESAGWLSSAFASNNSNSNNNTNAAAAAIQTTGQVFVRESRWSNSALLASTRAVLPRIIHCALYSLTLTTAGTTRVHPGRVAALRASLTRLLRLLHRAGDGTWYVCYMTQWANMHAGHIAAALLSTQPARLQDFSLAALATVDALLSLGSASWEEVMQALLYLSTGVRGTCGQDDTDGEGKRGSRSAMRALLAATAHTSPRHTTSTKEGASHSSLHESETTPSLSAETRCVVLLDALLQARTASHDGGKDDCVVPPPCKVRRMGRSELAASLALLAELLRPGSAPSAATLTLVLHVLAGLRVAQVIHTRRADMRSTSTSGSNNNTTTSEEEDLFSDKRYATLLTRVLEVLSGAPVHLLNNAEGNNTATMVVTLRVLQKLLPSLLPRASLAAMSGADSSRIANAAVAFVNRALLPTLLYGVQSLRASDIVARTPLMVTCLHLLRALLAVGVVGTPSSSSSLSSSSAVAATISGTNAPSSQPPAAMSTTEWPVLRALRSECVNYLVSERFFCYAPEALRAWLEVWRVLGSDKPLRVLLTDKLAGGTSRLSAIITSAESEANQRARQLRCLAFYTLALSSPQANDREFVHYVRDQLNDALARYSGTLPLPTVEQLGSRAVWLAPMSAVMMLFRVLLLKLYDVTLQNMCALLMPELMRGLMLAASVMPSAKEGGARGKEAMSPAVRAELTDFVMECLKVLDTALLVCPQAMASYRGIFFPDCATQTQGVAMGNDSKRGHDGGESRSFTPLLVPLVQGSTTGANSAPCEDDRDGMAMPHNDCVSRTHACPAPCDAQAAQWLPLVCYGDGRRNEDEEEAAAASRSTSTHGCGAPRPVLRLARVQYEQRPDCVVQSASALLRQARLWQTNELSCNEQRRTTGYDAQDVVWRLLADMTLVDTHPML